MSTLLSLFGCAGCRMTRPQPSRFPLCEACADSLIPAPPLCPRCAGPDCPGATLRAEACARPWRRQLNIDGYTALYLSVGPGHEVLRSWKKRRGPLFNHAILSPALGRETLGPLLRRCEIIVPVPQSSRRAWTLRGSPVERLARAIASAYRIPCAMALKGPLPPADRAAGIQESHQARLGASERLLRKVQFETLPEAIPSGASRACLVDDFLTSGRTADAAAHALKQAGLTHIEVLCLGLRPRLHAGGAAPVSRSVASTELSAKALAVAGRSSKPRSRSV